jgi:RNA polymerase sigma-70 factor (family 1)
MNYKSINENILIDLWKEGDERAFNELYSRYFNKLYYYTLKFLADTNLAEEVVMDVMLNIWQKKHLLQSDRCISSYLFRSVKNKLIDYSRKQILQTVSLDDSIVGHLSYEKSDARILESEMNQQYRKGLSKLSEKKQAIFKMSREEGLTYQEIALKLQLSKNTIENHMVAALKTLRLYVNVGS